MEKSKTEVKNTVLEHIRAGNNYSQTKDLLEKAGIKYPALKTSFYKWKQEINPEDARASALEKLKAKKDKDKDKTSPPKNWNKGKQKEADESVFADVINDGIFMAIPCPQKNLSAKDVKDINLGGAIVGLVSYYTDVNLNHPIIIFVTRAIMLVLKVRKMCYMLSEKLLEAAEKAKSALPGQGSIK